MLRKLSHLHPWPQAGTDFVRSRLNWYKSLGIFIGRALLDSRIIDVNLNVVFVQLILDMPVKANIATLKQVDPQLARSLERLQSYLSARKEIESLPLVRQDSHLLILNKTHTDTISLPRQSETSS